MAVERDAYVTEFSAMETDHFCEPLHIQIGSRDEKFPVMVLLLPIGWYVGLTKRPLRVDDQQLDVSWH
jgi:hypothetical protein